MQIVIDIPDLTYESIMKSKVLKDVGVDFIRNGKPLPNNATNGDVIKALFPNGSQVKGASIYVMNDNKSNIFYDFDWWNALYKAGDTDGNSGNDI